MIVTYIDLLYHSWEEFYGTSEVDYIKRTNETKAARLTAINESYYVSFCNFIRIKSAAILQHPDSTDIKLLVEDSSYTSCLDGSIRFGGDGYGIQNRICGLKSQAKRRGVFGSFGGFKSNIKLIGSSLSCSGANTGIGEGNFAFANGRFNISTTNISHAFINKYCIIENDFTHFSSNASFCTFANNKQKNDAAPCTSIEFGYTGFLINSCNFINNTGGNYLISGNDYTSISIKKCNFENNINKNSTIYIFSGIYTTTCDNCYFGLNQDVSGNVTTINNAINQNDLNFYHFITYQCIYDPTFTDEIEQIHINNFMILSFFVNVVYNK